MKVSILDDYFDTLRTLDCFEKLDGHEVTVFTDHIQDVDQLADRLATAKRWYSFANVPRSEHRFWSGCPSCA